MKRRAFTLIELLVVIAIIAILAAILFPVFASTKKAAKPDAYSISESSSCCSIIDTSSATRPATIPGDFQARAISAVQGTTIVDRITATIGEVDWSYASLRERGRISVVSFPIKPIQAKSKGNAYLQWSTDGKKETTWLLFLPGDGSVRFLDGLGSGLELRFDRTGKFVGDKLISGANIIGETIDGPQLADWNSYWRCVRDCMRWAYQNLPWWLRFICEAACGGCLWGGQLHACAGCASCIGSAGAWCMWNCRGR